jgi:peptidoglycan glycosyltransferase
MQPRHRFLIAWPAALLGLTLIGSGLLLADDVQWRLHLLTGLWLLSLLPRMLLSAHTPVVSRGLARLALVLVLGFGGVALQLTRNQISQADAIRNRAAVLFASDLPAVPEIERAHRIPAAERVELGSGRVWPVSIELPPRGTIYDRDGNVLATSRSGQRSYPNADLGHVVGFQSRLYGLTGIEASYDTYLSGERSLSVGGLLQARLMGTAIAPIGADLFLTLDTRLQEVAQQALGQRRGAVVLLDPRTGAILALVSYPRFDPNQLVLPDQASEEQVAALEAVWQTFNNRSDSPLLNRATQGRYPPGSIIKTLTAAAALDSSVLEFPESRITCPNRLPTEAGAPPVRNAVENLASSTGDPSDLRRVYAFSCNTAFAQIGLALGADILADYAFRFGLTYAEGEPRPADLREIAADRGSIASTRDFLNSRRALADTAYGQGQILITPLDMAQMVAVIANDGAMMRPYLVQEAHLGDQVLYQAEPEIVRQTIRPASAQRMRSIMETSVEIGYAAPVAIPGVAIGAKTGTAEVPSGAPHSWFVAIAPLDEPRFAIAVVVENGGEGSIAALPVARQVLAAALQS